MNKTLTIISLITVLASCDSTAPKTNEITEVPKDSIETPISPVDTTPKVTGIGGIFFFSDNPKKTNDWYGKNLGLAIDDYGSVFESRNANRPAEINYLRWSPFQKGDDYLKPSKKDFMINYRVQNIEGLVTKLRANGATILDSLVTYDYGKFIHLIDPDGNKIELWEPVDSVLTKLGGKTTK